LREFTYYSTLDIISVRVYLRINHVKENSLKELIKYLISRKDTSWISTIGGNYDLICTFFAYNASQFNKNLREIISKFPQLIKEFTILTTIVIRNFDRTYLAKSIISNERFIGGDRKPEKIDKIDTILLNLISENARASSVQLARKLSITPKTVISRIKELEKKEIITGYKTHIEIRNMNYISKLLLIKYHNISVELEINLINFLKYHQNVISVVKTLGEWDLEITIEAKDTKDFRKIEIEIREKYSTLIQNIKSLPLYENLKKNFFPKFILEELESSNNNSLTN
jgi:DNA-binding Lrp family transcriptional regulator